jgi:hypothetical protein
MSTAELTSLALENQFGLADRVVDHDALANSVRRFREQGIVLPTFAELADPSTRSPRASVTPTRTARTPQPVAGALVQRSRGTRVDVPDHVVLPKSLTGVDSPIIVVFGDRFPMITAHKVLAAYACLAPRVVTGSSTRRAIGRSGRRPATTRAAASRSAGSWPVAAWQSSPRA